MIVIHNLQQTTGAASATALMLDGELNEQGPPMRMLTNLKDERTEREVTGKVG